jgi:tetratricopeptide (TPR) repeat protein
VNLLAGRVDEALAEATLALELARARHARGYEAEALRCLGDAAAQATPSDTEAAEGYYRAALALADELGMRPLQAHCHLGLGKLFRHLGRIDEARGELATAVEMRRDMGMSLWLAEAEAEATVVSTSAQHIG